MALVVAAGVPVAALHADRAEAFGTNNFTCTSGNSAQGSTAASGGSYTVSARCLDVRVRNRMASGAHGAYHYDTDGLVAISGARDGWIGGTHGARRTAATGYFSTLT